jgi:hypothetical protein
MEDKESVLIWIENSYHARRVQHKCLKFSQVSSPERDDDATSSDPRDGQLAS